MYNDGCSVTGKVCTCGGAGFCVACVEAREGGALSPSPDEWCKTCRLAVADTNTGQCADCYDYQYAASDKPSEPWHQPRPPRKVRTCVTDGCEARSRKRGKYCESCKGGRSSR